MAAVSIPGARSVTASFDEPEGYDTVVVACPPHPQHGGSRHDPRLRTVSDALTATGLATLRIDYGAWDEGHGEREDARNAIRWARSQVDHVGVFGYSFGAGIAILAAATIDPPTPPVAALAPPATLGPELDVVAAGRELESLHLCVGNHDTTVNWQPVAREADVTGFPVRSVESGHFFQGETSDIATWFADGFGDELSPDRDG